MRSLCSAKAALHVKSPSSGCLSSLSSQVQPEVPLLAARTRDAHAHLTAHTYVLGNNIRSTGADHSSPYSKLEFFCHATQILGAQAGRAGQAVLSIVN